MLIINKHYSTIIVINVPNRVETVSAQYSRGNIISFGVQFMNSTEENNIERLEFAIFCIENIAVRLNKDARAVYAALAEKSDILYGYIVPEFEILHTQSKDYIIDDIIDVMKERGVEV